eukprot:7386176-Prymnesium_polylepis.5
MRDRVGKDSARLSPLPTPQNGVAERGRAHRCGLRHCSHGRRGHGRRLDPRPSTAHLRGSRRMRTDMSHVRHVRLVWLRGDRERE